MGQLFRKYKLQIWLGILLVPLFLIYIYLPITTGSVFNSPDETMNYVFAEKYGRSGELAIDRPLNLVSEKQLQPRSVNVNSAGQIVPQGFLGMPILYGLAAKYFGAGVIEFITPLLAVIAIFAFYGLLKFYFKRQVALFSAIFLAIHPVFIYYSARTMMNNVPAISLIIIGLYLLHVALNRQKRALWAYLGFGVAIALAMMMRTSEFAWVTVIILIVLIANRQKVQWFKLGASVLLMIILFMPIFHFNNVLYGDYFNVGYSQLDEGTDSQVEYLDVSQSSSNFDKDNQALIVAPTKSVVGLVKMLVAPFGLHEKLMLKTFYRYVLYIFWWLSIPMVLGIALKLKNIWQRKEVRTGQKSYLLFYALSSLLALIYYGSWWLFLYHTNYDLLKPTIDISYVRYFLPIYIFGLPFVVLGWQWLAERFGNNWKRLAFYGVTGGFALYFSLFLALWGNDISLFQIKKNIDTYEHRATVVSEMIKSENTVIIIPDWADKVFAQDYLTMFVTNTEKFDLALMNLNKEGVEIYYYSERPDDEVIKFSEQRLVPLGLSLESFGHVFENERMFKLIPLDTF